MSCLWIIYGPVSFAQQSSKVCLDAHGEIFNFPDSLILDPESIEVGNNLPYRYDAKNHQVVFGKVLATEICFRVLPIKIGQAYEHKTMDIYDSTVSFYDTRVIQSTQEKEELFETTNIYKSGSLTRGILLGNSQSVNVISSFNFQMDGQLTENLNVRADLTDQNIPFEPEGNTQQIREFDNVALEVYNQNLSLKAGDIVLKEQENYFLKYNKNTLGGQVNLQYDIHQKAKSKSSLAVTSAKGQFADITIEALEGLQGPYQIFGPNGESLVVVLANSENVYVDGQLLKRGFNHDYTIDYNLGEITFNPTILITQFSRIRITYEYSDQNYSRSIIAANQDVDLGKAQLSVNYYREKDNKNKPLAFGLTDSDMERISQAGEDDLPVPIDGAQVSSYSNELVLYELIDTLDQASNVHMIYSYTTDSVGQLYSVSFTNVGEGSGDYVLLDNEVNGSVYEWIAPVSGVSQGSYDAVRFVPAPNSKQMFTLGTKVSLGKHITWTNDFALSDQDLNLYSDIGDEDNQDLAFKTGITLDKLASGGFLDGYVWSGGIDYEYDGGNFKTIDRYRQIEYDRDWSYVVSEDTFFRSDNILNVNASLKKDSKNQVSMRYARRQKENAIDGYQHEQEIKKSFGGLCLSANHFYLTSNNFSEKSQWRRWSLETYYDDFWIVPGYRIEEDKNEVKSLEMDSLLSSAMNYLSHQFYLRSPQEKKIKYVIDHTLREDHGVLEGILEPYTVSNTTSATINAELFKNQLIDLVFTYRDLDYQEAYSDLEDEKLVLGKLYWGGDLLKRHVRSDLSYTTSSSQEILKEYIYILVSTGEGTHTWRDLNADGVEDLTEFFEAINFDERNYIRVFIPTTETVDAFNTVFNFTLNATMPRSWKSKTGFKKMMGQWSNNTNITINKKTTEEGLQERFNPFSLEVTDERLIYTRDTYRSTFFFNRSGKGLGMDFTLSSQSSKQLISQGIDSKYTQDYLLNIRYHINSEWAINMALNKEQKENASEFSEDWNYDINIRELAPTVVWQPQNNLRFSTAYSLSMRENEFNPEQPETSGVNQLKFESRWSRSIKNALTASFSYTNIVFDGDENSAAAYELLDALESGDNYTWQFNYNQKLISGLQLSVSYEGRKSPDTEYIHTGRMQVIALF